MYKDRLIEDRFILYNINNLYSLNKLEVENRHFSIGQNNLEHMKNSIKSKVTFLTLIYQNMQN